MKEKTARTSIPRLGLELPDVLLPDIRDHPTKVPAVTIRGAQTSNGSPRRFAYQTHNQEGFLEASARVSLRVAGSAGFCRNFLGF